MQIRFWFFVWGWCAKKQFWSKNYIVKLLSFFFFFLYLGWYQLILASLLFLFFSPFNSSFNRKLCCQVTTLFLLFFSLFFQFVFFLLFGSEKLILPNFGAFSSLLNSSSFSFVEYKQLLEQNLHLLIFISFFSLFSSFRPILFVLISLEEIPEHQSLFNLKNHIYC